MADDLKINFILKKLMKVNGETLDVLVYDEDFITNNLKWDQGIKSFVVIGKKSKEDEENLKTLLASKGGLVVQKKIIDAEIKKNNRLN